jgi:hypothetical protein
MAEGVVDRCVRQRSSLLTYEQMGIVRILTDEYLTKKRPRCYARPMLS